MPGPFMSCFKGPTSRYAHYVTDLPHLSAKGDGRFVLIQIGIQEIIIGLLLSSPSYLVVSTRSVGE